MDERKQGKFHVVDVVEIVGKINSNFFDLTTSNMVGNILDFESTAIDNVVAIKIMQLATIKIQATLWKTHHHSLVCWGFFVVNDNLPIDIVDPWMLKYIIYTYEQTSENVLINF
jgi:hypothetical protein